MVDVKLKNVYRKKLQNDMYKMFSFLKVDDFFKAVLGSQQN